MIYGSYYGSKGALTEDSTVTDTVVKQNAEPSIEGRPPGNERMTASEKKPCIPYQRSDGIQHDERKDDNHGSGPWPKPGESIHEGAHEPAV